MRTKIKLLVDEKYYEYIGLSEEQLYQALEDLNACKPHIKANINCRDKAARIAFINSEIVMQRGRACQ